MTYCLVGFLISNCGSFLIWLGECDKAGSRLINQVSQCIAPIVCFTGALIMIAGPVSATPTGGLRMSDPLRTVWIDYTNYRGVRAWRHILPMRESLRFKRSPWHPQSQWIIEAVDLDGQVTRGFALASIHEWRTSAP
jgi:hypothetical protein